MKAEYKPLNKELAYRCYAWTSFSPEKRGEQEIRGHKETFDELAAELGDFFEQKHADKLHALWTDYLSSHAGVMSPMITGPARFPVERNNKRAEWAHKKHNAIFEYCDKLRKWKKTADRREALENAGGELEIAKAELESAQVWHETMKAANRIIRMALKTEAGANSDATREKLHALPMMDEQTAMKITNPPERLKHYGLGFQSFELTNSNARIKNKAARVAELERREEASGSGKEPEEFEIDGGQIIYDYAANRINVKHDEKPSRDIINKIKARGFRWSRNFGTWTRQMTPNAKLSAEYLKRELAS